MPEEIKSGASAQPAMVVTAQSPPSDSAGPTVSYEEDLLREHFGEPDEDGIYRGDQG